MISHPTRRQFLCSSCLVDFFTCTSGQLLGDIAGAKTESITREQGDEHVDTYSHLKMVAIVKRDVIVLFLQPKREAHVQSVP